MMLSELHKRSALHARIELEQLHFAELLKKVGLMAKSAAFPELPGLASFVDRLDALLAKLSDERGVLKEFEAWWPEKRVDAMREAAANYVELRELTRVVQSCGDDLEKTFDEEEEEAAAEADAADNAAAGVITDVTVTVADCRSLVQMFERCAPVVERKERTLDADDRKYVDNKLPASRPVVTETKRATWHLARRHMRATLRLMSTMRGDAARGAMKAREEATARAEEAAKAEAAAEAAAAAAAEAAEAADAADAEAAEALLATTKAAAEDASSRAEKVSKVSRRAAAAADAAEAAVAEEIPSRLRAHVNASIKFAFRVHQLVGGFDAGCFEAFARLTDVSEALAKEEKEKEERSGAAGAKAAAVAKHKKKTKTTTLTASSASGGSR